MSQEYNRKCDAARKEIFLAARAVAQSSVQSLEVERLVAAFDDFDRLTAISGEGSAEISLESLGFA